MPPPLSMSASLGLGISKPSAAAVHEVTQQAALLESGSWWKLDETSGTTAYDSSAGGNNAALSTGASFASGGIDGYCVDLDGSDGEITIPADSINGTPPLTWSLWHKWDELENGRGLLEDTTYRAAPAFTIQFKTGNKIMVAVYYGAGGTHYNSCHYDVTGNADDEWHHYAFTVVDDGGDSKFEFFMDGTKKDVASNYGGTVSGDGKGFTVQTSISEDPAIWVGRERSTRMDGQIDDIRFYNIQLSDSEIAAIAAGDFG